MHTFPFLSFTSFALSLARWSTWFCTAWWFCCPGSGWVLVGSSWRKRRAWVGGYIDHDWRSLMAVAGSFHFHEQNVWCCPAWDSLPRLPQRPKQHSFSRVTCRAVCHRVQGTKKGDIYSCVCLHVMCGCDFRLSLYPFAAKWHLCFTTCVCVPSPLVHAMVTDLRDISSDSEAVTRPWSVICVPPGGGW
jgi:hypothetical protein